MANDDIARHVYGNLLRLGINLTLQWRTSSGGYYNQDFVPAHDVFVILSNGAFGRRYKASIDDSVAWIEDEGKLPIGQYGIEVLTRDAEGHPLRYKRRNVLRVYDTTLDAGIQSGVEFEVETHILDAAVFVATGGGIVYDDTELKARIAALEEASESDPSFAASPAAGITQEDIDKWNEGSEGYDVTYASGNLIFGSNGKQPTFSNGNLIL